jgi:hypothetical protein
MALVAGLSIASGCGTQSHVTSGWADGAARGEPFRRVLVVGVSPDLDQRCNFERFLAQRINSEATQAITSCSAVTQRDPLTRESIEEAVAAKQIDAVIATVLVAKSYDVKEGGTMDTRGGGAYKAVDSGWGTGYYGVYGVPVIYAEFKTQPSVLSVSGDAEVMTRVYDARTAQLVYSLDTKVTNAQSRPTGLDALTTPIAERLRRDGLTR